MNLKNFLQILVEKEGSDLYLTTGAKPAIKAFGKMIPIDDEVIKPNEIKILAYEIMSETQIRQFESKPEMNLALSETGLGRFRVNLFVQRGQVGLVARHIKTDIPGLEALGIPPVLKEIMMEKNGLILFVGATGTGKSTSLASLIDYRNNNAAGHIVTIEDPIEYIHKHKKSIINQREVGIDTACYEDALVNTLRQAPDVILIGEIRSRETMKHAIAFSETGHLCLSTLHANNANQTLDRIVNFFPQEQQPQLLLDLSLNLRAIISQRLVPSLDGKRVAAFEILIGTPLIRDLIHRNEINSIKEIMEKSENVGMQTFDTALYNLYKEKKISLEEALNNADSKNNLRLHISLEEQHPNESQISNLELEDPEDNLYEKLNPRSRRSPSQY